MNIMCENSRKWRSKIQQWHTTGHRPGEFSNLLGLRLPCSPSVFDVNYIPHPHDLVNAICEIAAREKIRAGLLPDMRSMLVCVLD